MQIAWFVRRVNAAKWINICLCKTHVNPYGQ